ncbi:MAG: 1-acyl-sn-glycerol-3-phosphate acyltransferase [Pseudomonadota bacterium]
MSGPWPERQSPSPLFILDAAHSPEAEHLKQWISDTAPEGVQPVCLLLPIANRQETIDARALIPFLELNPDTELVPVRIVWQQRETERTRPPRFRDLLRGDFRQPSEKQAREILRQEPGRAECVAAASATLAQLTERFEATGQSAADRSGLAQFIAGRAGLALDIAERKLRGGRYKVPRRIANNLKASRRYQTALARVAEETGEPISALEARAEGIFKELIAIPQAAWQDGIAAFNRKVIGMGYEQSFVMDDEQLKRVRDIVRNKPTVLLWTHKTHVDGFAVYSMMFENDFPVPHLLGGVNMAFAGLGYAARRSGGIFIRRSFQDDLLYKMILRQYIGYLLEKRFPLTWAFEGTRSRVGKLMPPRYGVLKYVLEAAAVTESTDLHVIPVALNYDLIGDVRDYVREQSGGVKQPESLRWFIGYLRGLRKRLGRIYIDFGEPIVVEDPTAVQDGISLKKLAFEVGVQANKVTPITLASLVTMILLGAAPRALTRNQLGRQMLRYLRWARARGIRIGSDFDQSTPAMLNEMADVLGESGLVTRFDEGPDIVYTLAPDQHGVASYYRNTIVHHFVVKAFIELAILDLPESTEQRLEQFWAEVDRLRDLFKFEFFYVSREAFREKVDEELKRYSEDWQTQIVADPGVPDTLLRKLKPLMSRATLLPFVEAYGIVARVVCAIPGGESIDRKTCLEQAFSYGKQAYLQRRISSEASVGKLFFDNAYSLMDNLKLIEPAGVDLLPERKAFARTFVDLANRLDRIAMLDAPSDRI